MNVKRLLGTLLTILGLLGLVYAAYIFMNTSGGTRNMKSLAMYAVLGAVFFFAGIGLSTVYFYFPNVLLASAAHVILNLAVIPFCFFKILDC